MRTPWLVIFLITTLGYDLAAQPKTIHLRIDTIDYYDKVETISKFVVFISNKGSSRLANRLDSMQKLTLNPYPNYTSTLLLENDSSMIELPIDLNGSTISIADAYNLQSDTLRISKLILYKTQNSDTTFTLTEYYKVINGKLNEKPFRLKRKVESKKEIAPPMEIELAINQNLYKTTIIQKTRVGMDILHGHEYRPRNYMDKEGYYKKRVTYIYSNSKTNKYNWKGQLKI